MALKDSQFPGNIFVATIFPAHSAIILKSSNYGKKIMMIVYYTVDECELDGETHRFEYSEGAIRPKTNGDEDVVGCGLLVDSNDKLAIFFTLNGTLCGAQIPISPSVDVLYLYPAVALWHAPIEANFGGNPDKPFAYDIKNCPGMELDCI